MLYMSEVITEHVRGDNRPDVKWTNMINMTKTTNRYCCWAMIIETKVMHKHDPSIQHQQMTNKYKKFNG